MTDKKKEKKETRKYTPVPRNSFERRLFQRFEEHARLEKEINRRFFVHSDCRQKGVGN